MKASPTLEPRMASKVPPPRKTAPKTAPSQPATSSFALQGAIGFLAGGLLALIGSAASALGPLAEYETLCRGAGFALGAALGGVSLAWGMSKKSAPSSAAFGFAVGFLLPAWQAGAALNSLLALKLAAYGAGTLAGTTATFAIGFGLAGAFGALFLAPQLFWAGMKRFGLAGAVGGLVVAQLPRFDLSNPQATSGHLLAFTATMLAGHLLPFTLGGLLFGRAVATYERSLPGPKREL